MWDFAPQANGQLGFSCGEVIMLLREETTLPGWGFASRNGNTGYVPLSYLKIDKTEAPVAPPRKDKEEVPEDLTQMTPRSAAEKERIKLLQWVQQKIPEYHVTNFTSSWRDGCALMALCNALRPGTFDLPSQFRSPLENAELAMSRAEELLDVPRTIQAVEMCSPKCSADLMEYYVRGFVVAQRRLLEKADADERERRKASAIRRRPRQKPEASSVWCNIVSKSGAFHSSIALDGEVTDRFGDVMGYLDLDEMRAFSRVQEPLGYMLSESLYESRGGGDGTFCGEVNRGIGSIHDRNGSTLVHLDVDGTCKGQTAVYLGRFEGCGLRELDAVALYVMFIDPEFYDEEAEDEVHRPPLEAPQDSLCNVLDKERTFRASISQDGEVRDCYGDLMGYLDIDGHRVASADQKLLGYFSGNTIVSGDKDEHLGEVDKGRGLVIAANGSSILTLDASGDARGATSVYLGQFHGFGYHELEIIALYVLLLDQKFVDEDE